MEVAIGTSVVDDSGGWGGDDFLFGADGGGGSSEVGGCNGSNSGYYDANGTLNVCIYGSESPAPDSIETLPTIQVTPTPGELAETGMGEKSDMGSDAVASGLTAYSTLTDRLLEMNDIRLRGLPAAISHLPAGVGGAIGVLETVQDVRAGDNRKAAQDGGAALGSVIGAEVGAMFPIPGVDVLTAGVGSMGGAILGRVIGGRIYDRSHPINRQ